MLQKVGKLLSEERGLSPAKGPDVSLLSNGFLSEIRGIPRKKSCSGATEAFVA